MNRLPQFIVDGKGRKKAVLLPIDQYDRMLEELEDLRDTLELEKRVKTCKELVPYQSVRNRLVKQGKL